jgi:SAM-dependent methyltransferase
MSSQESALVLPSCNLCGSDRLKPTWRKNGYDLVRCQDCGLLFVANPPGPQALQKLYSFEAGYHAELAADDWAARHHRNEARRNLTTLQRHARRGRLLDIGCSTGLFLELARDAGFDAVGIEYSPDSARIAQGKGLDVAVGALTADRYADGSFDIITLWDVIEHLPDPQATVALAARMLKPGGLLVAKTPNCDGWYPRLSLALASRVGFWGHPDPPGHLFQFSAETLSLMFSENGLKPTALHHGRIPLRYSFGAPRDWFRSTKWALYCLALMPIAAAAPWFGAGDDITLVGNKSSV